MSELKKGEIKPIMLDLTGVTGGTYSYNMGALTNGHVYIASLSGSQASPLKIYYWDTPTSKPEVIAMISKYRIFLELETDMEIIYQSILIKTVMDLSSSEIMHLLNF